MARKTADFPALIYDWEFRQWTSDDKDHEPLDDIPLDEFLSLTAFEQQEIEEDPKTQGLITIIFPI